MKSIRNSIQLMGHLGKDPELKTFDNDRKLVKFSLATNEKYKNKDGELVEETQWHNLVAWGKLAENMNSILKKGNEITVKGKLTHRSYEDSNGVTKYISEIVVNEFVKITKPQESKVS